MILSNPNQAVVSVEAQNLELPALPYEYDALEPAIDERTMRVHHLGHHQAYLNTINGVMTALRSNEETKYLAKMVRALLYCPQDQPHGTVRLQYGYCARNVARVPM
jgi:superoxide dismutase